MELTTEQRGLLSKYIQDYKNWLKTEDGRANLEDHRSHFDFFSKYLSKTKLPNLTEEEFRNVYKTLWASNIWSNKDWYIDNKLLAPNSLSKIKALQTIQILSQIYFYL